MNLDHTQKEQVERQLAALKEYKGGLKEIILDSSHTLSLLINNGVFGSDIIEGAKILAAFLYENKHLYKNKTVLDMGCGPGTQGLVTIENGAKKITFADINPRAIENVEENIKLKNIKNYEIYESNLFQNIPDNKFDIIIFNHPFFPEDSDSYKSMERDDNLIKKSMLADVSLINRFLLDAKRYLHTDGKIIMPYFHLAGPQNDPKTYNEKYGFKIDEYMTPTNEGIQKGEISIYLLESINKI